MHEALKKSAPTAGVRCLLCGGAGAPLFEIANYWVHQCASCDHRFTDCGAQEGHIERVYGDDYFTHGGAGYSNYVSEERVLVARGRWYARRMARYCKPGTVLDVGAAAGFTLRGLSEAGWQGFGVEPNAGMAKYARQRFGFPVEAASWESWTSQRTFDLVTMLQVIAHFVDPRQAMLKAGELVRPGGHLLIETWNRESWTARLFGRNWHEYSPPSVLHWFSAAGLIRLARRTGFQLMARGRPSRRISASHAKVLLRHKSASSIANRVLLGIAQVLPDRLEIPYPSEDLVWMLFQRL